MMTVLIGCPRGSAGRGKLVKERPDYQGKLLATQVINDS